MHEFKHDPLCTAYYKDLIDPRNCFRCELILAARADERKKIAND